MRYLAAFLLAIVLLTAVNTASAQRDLAIVGSSTSACYGATVTDSCYVGRLRSFYNQQAPSDTTIDNGFAVGSYNCYRGMPTGYVPPYAAANFQPDPGHNITAAIASNPNVILVNYPTNDYDVLPLDSILFCLRTIRQTANQAGIPCYVTTTQPRTTGAFGTSPIKAKLAELKDSILFEFGYYAIDFYTKLINPADSSIRYDAGDGTHMNNTGHDSLFVRVLAKNVFLSALPVTFLQFNTIYKNNSGIISWLVTRESEVSNYEIQRSGDGVNFLTIASVNAINGPGNTQYQYTDDQPLKGSDYYRIIVIDRDGKKHASPVMKINTGNGKLSVVKAYAPSATQLIVSLQNNESQNAQLQIYNNAGMLISSIYRKLEAGNTTLYLGTPVLSTGVYHIKITAGTASAVYSFMKN